MSHISFGAEEQQWMKQDSLVRKASIPLKNGTENHLQNSTLLMLTCRNPILCASNEVDLFFSVIIASRTGRFKQSEIKADQEMARINKVPCLQMLILLLWLEEKTFIIHSRLCSHDLWSFYTHERNIILTLHGWNILYGLGIYSPLVSS